MDLIEETARVEVTEKFLETFGSGSLVGLLANQHGFKIPSTVVLVFPQSSVTYCRKNGPHQYIVHESAIRCLLEDVLQLRGWGVAVPLETVTRDPAD